MSVSFIHGGGANMASFRYRAAIPAREIGAVVNDTGAQTLIFAKPQPTEWHLINNSKTVIADFCDDHFARMPYYMELAERADAVTCPTPAMAERIKAAGYNGEITVIPDPYEFAEEVPHLNGNKLLWFGHKSNFPSLLRVMREITHPLMIVSNAPGTMPWSIENMLRAFMYSDIVIIPATAPYKSANRALEAIRQGCFVVAEPHPSLEGFEGIWIGNINEGVEWAVSHKQEANYWTAQAQTYIAQRYSPKTQGDAWKRLLATVKSRSTSEAVQSTGQGGYPLICTTKGQNSNATYAP